MAARAPLAALVAAIACGAAAAADPQAVHRERPPDVFADDGAVYRHVAGYGYRFHPLASFAQLNRVVSRGEAAVARRLARALLARGIEDRGALVWEYDFPFGGPVRWRSGFVQAVAAQAFERASRLTDEPAFAAAARAAVRAVPRLSRPLAGGVWIREYGFSDTAILNAQLQSLISIRDYAETSGDRRGRTLAEGLARAARALLRRFDTGCWSRYALDGPNASLHYHAYHVQLLRKLATRDPAPIWRTTSERWNAFLVRRHLPCSRRSAG